MGYAALQHLAGSTLNPGGSLGRGQAGEGGRTASSSNGPKINTAGAERRSNQASARVSGRRGRTGRLALRGRGHAVTHGGPPPCTPQQGSASLLGPGAAGEASVGDPCRHHPQHPPQHPSPVPGRWAPPSPEGLVPAPLGAPLGSSPPGFAGREAQASPWCTGVQDCPPHLGWKQPPGTREPGIASQGRPGWLMGTCVVPSPFSHGSTCPQVWSRRTSPRMLAGSAQTSSAHPNCTNTHRCPGVAALCPEDGETATPAPRPWSQRRSRHPSLRESPAQPFPSPRVPVGAQTPDPSSASNRPNQLELCGNHPHEFTAPPKSRAPGSRSPPFSELLKASKVLARQQTRRMGDPGISSSYHAWQRTQSCPRLPGTPTAGKPGLQSTLFFYFLDFISLRLDGKSFP